MLCVNPEMASSLPHFQPAYECSGRGTSRVPVAGNFLERGQPFKSPDRAMGPTSTLRPSMTSPTLPRIYKEAQRPGRSEFYRQQSYTQSPSLVLQKSAGVIALREVLSKTPSKLLPPYPCIGHHSLPFPSAGNAPSPNPAMGPSKGPDCRCLW